MGVRKVYDMDKIFVMQVEDDLDRHLDWWLSQHIKALHQHTSIIPLLSTHFLIQLMGKLSKEI